LASRLGDLARGAQVALPTHGTTLQCALAPRSRQHALLT